MASSEPSLIPFDKPAGLKSAASVLHAGTGLRYETILDLEPEASGVVLLREESKASPPRPAGLTVVYWFLTSRVRAQVADHFSDGETMFSRVKSNPYIALWEVRTNGLTTARELCRWAKENGIILLGEENPRSHVFGLHRVSVETSAGEIFSSPAPRLFERLGLHRDDELMRILSAIDRRERLFHFFDHPEIAIRLVHDEDARYRVDLLGKDVVWVANYGATFTPRDSERWRLIGWILDRHVYIRQMQNRGVDPLAREAIEIGEIPEEWSAREGTFQFLFRKNSGLSSGLFLDQRKNRDYLFKNCRGQKVLNLFAYTGGFTVAALAGHAETVTHVDISGAHNEWAKKNIELNHLPAGDRVRWIKDNCLVYLGRLQKRAERFDWIICDPPSFSRDGKTTFQIERDFLPLIQQCQNILAPGGRILFSTNYEKQNRRWFERKLRDFLGKDFQVQFLDGDLDFELLFDDPALKAFLIQRI